MSTNKLNLKDYIIIYLIILIVIAFIAGFFLGAKTMEEKMSDINYNEDNSESISYSDDDINKFYFQIYEPTYSFNLDVYNLSIQKEPVEDSQKQKIIENGNMLLSNIEVYSFESTEIKKAIVSTKENINYLLKALENDEIIYSDEINSTFLTSQKYFYSCLWNWSSLSENIDTIINASTVDWETWKKSDLHLKDYIIAFILEENSIHTFNRPEDITVHIDAYLGKSDNEISIDLLDVINLLISSESIENKDFLKYIEKYPDWYTGVVLPSIPNFN